MPIFLREELDEVSSSFSSNDRYNRGGITKKYIFSFYCRLRKIMIFLIGLLLLCFFLNDTTTKKRAYTAMLTCANL